MPLTVSVTTNENVTSPSSPATVNVGSAAVASDNVTDVPSVCVHA